MKVRHHLAEEEVLLDVVPRHYGPRSPGSFQQVVHQHLKENLLGRRLV